MSDEAHETGENSIPPEVLHMIAAEVSEEDALRWTPTTVVIDLIDAFAGVLEAGAGFFRAQAHSLAARASLKEALEDRAIKMRIRKEERLRMQLDTLEDIEFLPGMEGR